MSDWRRVELFEESELGTFAVRRGRVTLALGMGAWVAGGLGLAVSVTWLLMPPGVLLLLLAPFLSLGAGWIVVGIRAIAQERRRRRLLAERPGEPWVADYPWQPPVVCDRAGSQLISLVARLAMGLTCGAPLAAGLWLIEDEGLAVVVGLLTLAAGGIGVAYTGHRALRWLRQGTSRLELASFPVMPGQDLHATYRPGRHLTVPGTLRMTLRFVSEEHELRKGFGRVPDVDVVCYCLYEDRWHLPVPGGSVDPAMGIPLAIRIPAEALDRGWVNGLSQRPARYWQLLVEADQPGPVLRSAFFVPVYGPAPERPD